MRSSRWAPISLAVMVTLSSQTPLEGQQEIIYEEPILLPGPWVLDNFPYLIGNPNDGVFFIGRVQYRQSADYLDRVSIARRVLLEGGLSTRGSRFLSLGFDGDRVAPGWRVDAELRLERSARQGFYGLGNKASGGGLTLVPGASRPFQVERSRAVARLDIARELVGPLRVAVGGSILKADWDPVSGGSVFGQQFPGGLEQNDAIGRVAAIVDIRDREFEPSRGVVVEAGFYGGSGGEGYRGGYGLVSGFITPMFGTVIAVRAAGRSLSSDATLDARFTIPTWGGALEVLGGTASHRGLNAGRKGGRGVLFGSAEVRQTILDAGDFGAVSVLGFVDAGRVFEEEDFRLTLKGHSVGGGGGITLRVLRASTVSLTVATGPDGVKWMVGSGWMF